VHERGYRPGAFDDVIAEIRYQATLALDHNEYAEDMLNSAVDHAAWQLAGGRCPPCQAALGTPNGLAPS